MVIKERAIALSDRSNEWIEIELRDHGGYGFQTVARKHKRLSKNTMSNGNYERYRFSKHEKKMIDSYHRIIGELVKKGFIIRFCTIDYITENLTPDKEKEIIQIHERLPTL